MPLIVGQKAIKVSKARRVFRDLPDRKDLVARRVSRALSARKAQKDRKGQSARKDRKERLDRLGQGAFKEKLVLPVRKEKLAHRGLSDRKEILGPPVFIMERIRQRVM